MGIYLNPGSEKLEMSRRSEIYIDKSGIISVLKLSQSVRLYR